MSNDRTIGSGWPRNLLDSLQAALPDGGDTATTKVIEVRGASPSQRAELVARIERDHERPVYRLTSEDLMAPPHERAAAALRLLDAAQTAGAIPMLDAVDALLPDDAAVVAMEDRLRTFPGVVVVSNAGPSRLKAVVTTAVQPD